jgi:carbamate kinase
MTTNSYRGKKIAVIALGGNSLIRDPLHITVEDQEAALRETSHYLADMAVEGWEMVIVHGNGPQVGFILRRSEIAHRVEQMHEVPLDVCGADTQGAIGYELQQALQNELYHRGVRKNVVTVITQTLVDSRDPAFSNPSKPIGGYMDQAEAERRRIELGAEGGEHRVHALVGRREEDEGGRGFPDPDYAPALGRPRFEE